MQSLPVSGAFKWISVLISGFCFYFGFSLAGNLGWLMWIAPVPILYVAFQVKSGQAFLLSFTAYTIGKLSWLSYLLAVLPKPLAIIYTLLIPLIFALIILAARKTQKATQNNFAVLAFPVFFYCLRIPAFYFFS